MIQCFRCIIWPECCLNLSLKTELNKSLLQRTLTVELSGLTTLTVCCKSVCVCVCVLHACVWRAMCKAVESGRGQIALSFVDELNKVISGFLEYYHKVQENWLVEQSLPRSCYTLTMHSVKAVVEKYLMGLEKEKNNFIQNHCRFFEHHLESRAVVEEDETI